ncbi:MAG: D-aminoacyl-tRNA deacylase [Candidatus Dormibacteraceae bacterium]
MRVVVQRVSRASVSWTGAPGEEGRNEIGAGLVILLGVAPGDTEATGLRLARKIANLRIFDDARGRFDRTVLDIGGEALVVSQFTLFADARRGRRPGFTGAGPPAVAKPLCDAFAVALRELGVPARTGRFGAQMAVDLVNDGPVTIVLSTEPWESGID